MTARFLIGIDLGTTNSAVAYVDTQGGDTRVRIFEVPQLVAPGEVAPRRQLPSFVYLAGEHDLAPAQTVLPWRRDESPERVIVGELARGQGARVPSRMIASAKSWLCHAGVDRQAAILPWGEGDGPKRSPVQAQAAVLGHVRDAWNHAHPDAPLADQEVMVTVPASFDEAARELTLEAAREAGFPPVVLLEEPQAAFYAWIDAHPGAARSLQPEDRVLVFDVGGGTTDFTLIAVDADGDGFARTAVGDHLLLGGDNLDLTLAKIVEQRLVEKVSGRKLDALQWHGLVHACRLAKEQILTEGGPDSVPITVASRGAKLLGGTLRDDVTRDELARALFEGFFPVVERDATVTRARGGLQEFGLPYAADPAVTRHLAAFLNRHAGGARVQPSSDMGASAPRGASHVDAVLFNGGAMTPPSLRARVIEVIAKWQGRTPRELEAVLPEMAVAQGAAYYGLVRRGLATRIKGGTPRAFYIGVEAEGEKLAVCVAAKGLDDGAQVTLDRDFVLLTNRPVRFALFSSTSRADLAGDLVVTGDGLPDMTDDGSDLLELPPLVTVLRARGRKEVTVRLEVRVTELGALEIHALDRESPDKWRLSFDLRSGGASKADDAADAQPHPRTDEAKARVVSAFRGSGNDLASLAKDLETMLEARRDEWSMLTARAIFDALGDVVDTRKRSVEHEQRWLNLAGFCLRPGTGAPLDTWRARQMWGVFNEGIAFPRSEANRLGWWITWRRIAGGLVKGQQDQIYDRLNALLFPGAKQLKKLHEVKPSKQELGEIWRTVASMERLTVATKIKLGDELMRRMAEPKGRDDALHVWAIGRLGARLPLYGPANLVVPPSKVSEWLRQLLAWDWPEPEKAAFPLAQLGRRTGDRARDLDDGVRAALATVLRTMPGGDRTAILVEQVVALEAREERVALGDTLPAGLRLAPEPEVIIEMEAD